MWYSVVLAHPSQGQCFVHAEMLLCSLLLEKNDYLSSYVFPGSSNLSAHLSLTSLISKVFPPTKLSLMVFL